MTINFDKAMALHQADVSDVGVKEVADHLNKAVSTMYAEIRQEHGYKHGVIDFFRFADRYGKINALRSLIADMGYSLVKLPGPGATDKEISSSVHKAMARATKECADGFAETLKALADGKITKKEAAKNSDEYQEAIEFMVHIKAMMDAIKNAPE